MKCSIAKAFWSLEFGLTQTRTTKATDPLGRTYVSAFSNQCVPVKTAPRSYVPSATESIEPVATTNHVAAMAQYSRGGLDGGAAAPGDLRRADWSNRDLKLPRSRASCSTRSCRCGTTDAAPEVLIQRDTAPLSGGKAIRFHGEPASTEAREPRPRRHCSSRALSGMPWLRKVTHPSWRFDMMMIISSPNRRKPVSWLAWHYIR